jgi:hypothetical protein
MQRLAVAVRFILRSAIYCHTVTVHATVLANAKLWLEDYDNLSKARFMPPRPLIRAPQTKVFWNITNPPRRCHRFQNPPPQFRTCSRLVFVSIEHVVRSCDRVRLGRLARLARLGDICGSKIVVVRG